MNNVHAFPFAVSGDSGFRRLYEHPDNSGKFSFFPAIASSARFSRVRATTLPALIRRNRIPEVDFLKLDCEGGEYAILQSVPRAILGRIKRMSIECHALDDDRSPAALSSYLSSRGFAVKQRTGGSPSGVMVYASRMGEIT